MFKCFKKEEKKENIILLHKDDTKYHIGDTIYALRYYQNNNYLRIPNKLTATIEGILFTKDGIKYKVEGCDTCINPEEYNGFISNFDYIIKRKIEDEDNN